MDDTFTLTRRAWLRLGALGAASSALTGCKGCKPTFLTGLLGRAGTGKRPTGPVDRVTSTCALCPSACGIRVRTIAGRATKIEGNPAHPVNGGRLCPLGQAGLHVLYDPDRLRTPLKRRPGAPWPWARTTWSEALGFLARRVADLRETGEARRVVFVTGGLSTYENHVVERLARCIGTPNVVRVGVATSEVLGATNRLTRAEDVRSAYDWASARTIYAFGANLLETFQPALEVQTALARRRASREPLRLVTIDPRLSVTAAKSDRWVPLRPGTDAALARALACVIVEEGLVDRGFLRTHTHGFERWRAELCSHDEVGRAARLTGIAREEIVELARAFAAERPAIAVAGGGVARQKDGLEAALAVERLNALVGSVGAPGGVHLAADPLEPAWPPARLDAAAREGVPAVRLDGAGHRYPLAHHASAGLADAILSRKPYPAEVVVVIGANPIHDVARRFREALEAVPLVVHLTTGLNETAMVADLVLPLSSYLESWGYHGTEGSIRAVSGLVRPAVAPRHGSRPLDAIVLALARLLGGDVASSFPWHDSPQALRAALGEHDAAARSNIWRDMEQAGFVVGEPRPTARTFDFAPSAVTKRSWWDDTESMSIAVETDEGFPLALNIYRTPLALSAAHINSPWLLDAFDGAEASAHLHPATAAAAGVADGERVWVVSEHGRVLVTVRVSPGLVSDVVHLAWGGGETAGGRWVRGLGRSPKTLVDAPPDARAGIIPRDATRVALVRQEVAA